MAATLEALSEIDMVELREGIPDDITELTEGTDETVAAEIAAAENDDPDEPQKAVLAAMEEEFVELDDVLEENEDGEETPEANRDEVVIAASKVVVTASIETTPDETKDIAAPASAADDTQLEAGTSTERPVDDLIADGPPQDGPHRPRYTREAFNRPTDTVPDPAPAAEAGGGGSSEPPKNELPTGGEGDGEDDEEDEKNADEIKTGYDEEPYYGSIKPSQQQSPKDTPRDSLVATGGEGGGSEPPKEPPTDSGAEDEGDGEDDEEKWAKSFQTQADERADEPKTPTDEPAAPEAGKTQVDRATDPQETRPQPIYDETQAEELRIQAAKDYMQGKIPDDAALRERIAFIDTHVIGSEQPPESTEEAGDNALEGEIIRGPVEHEEGEEKEPAETTETRTGTPGGNVITSYEAVEIMRVALEEALTTKGVHAEDVEELLEQVQAATVSAQPGEEVDPEEAYRQVSALVRRAAATGHATIPQWALHRAVTDLQRAAQRAKEHREALEAERRRRELGE